MNSVETSNSGGKRRSNASVNRAACRRAEARRRVGAEPLEHTITPLFSSPFFPPVSLAPRAPLLVPPTDADEPPLFASHHRFLDDDDDDGGDDDDDDDDDDYAAAVAAEAIRLAAAHQQEQEDEQQQQPNQPLLHIANIQLPQMWSVAAAAAADDDSRRARKRSFAAILSPSGAAATASPMQHSQPNSQQ